MMWTLRLRFAKWLLEPLEVERAQELVRAMELVTAQQNLIVALRSNDEQRRPTLQ